MIKSATAAPPQVCQQPTVCTNNNSSRAIIKLSDTADQVSKPAIDQSAKDT
jgi:hypothetical protein